MAHPVISHSEHDERPHAIEIRKIGLGDIRGALADGFDDFMSKPSHVVFLCIIYPVMGLILCRLAFGYDVLPLIYPLIAGFALLGPFAAVGLYEISRRREAGKPVAWRHALHVFGSAGFGSILVLGALLVVIFIAWLTLANLIYLMTFGPHVPASPAAFLTELFTTPQGLALILIGNGAGLLFALGVLSISVVSFPVILDRHVDALTAIRTSLRVMGRNPVVTTLWGLTIAVLLALGSLPLFIGLAVVMPLLGHASWHFYRRAVKR